MTKHKPPYFALTIAGSDSGGGAGIQADLKAFAGSGVFGTSVITAITAQNTQAVHAVQCVEADMVKAQLQAVFADFPIRFAKTGMLANSAIIQAVLANVPRKVGLIVDPVMIASSGAKLLADDAIASYQALIARAEIITPNMPEAECLAGHAINDQEQLLAAAKTLLAMGCKAVLLKGGHAPPAITGQARVLDQLFIAKGRSFAHYRFAKKRLAINGHGTGCTLAALITAHKARGLDTLDAVAQSLACLQRYLKAAQPIGKAKLSSPDPFWPRISR